MVPSPTPDNPFWYPHSPLTSSPDPLTHQYTSHEYLILIYEEILTYSDITETQTYVDSETVTLVYQ